jgi:hypothetical protein
MTVEIQIQEETLENIVKSNVQEKQNTTCFLLFRTFYIDHADVTGITMTTGDQNAGFQVPISFFCGGSEFAPVKCKWNLLRILPIT